MYRVAIIDDEPIIVEGMRKTFPWEKYGCQVAGCAYSGQEGIEMVDKVKPHIIISDISMPQMDGLTMIASIKSRLRDVQIMILTGYRDFDYAQRAISLGVTRFILKPSKMDELEEAVKAMTDKLRDANILPDDPSGQTDEVCCSPASNFIVKQALSYIEENYQQKMKLSDVADHVYVSQWHLSKLLNRYTEQTFSDILNSIRIEKAKVLLTDPSLRIGDIAEEVGFLDMAHFSRVFKKQVGISANEYRNTLI